MKETQIWAKHFLNPDDYENDIFLAFASIFRPLTRTRVKNDARPGERQK